MAKEISISQCMIVKNEEKNIRRALSWGKGIVREQIVVDTGSTDKTVEIAESMGATIYHFEWCDDFSAAKNYAIEKASGDWIAFLDADEYFNPEDARKVPEVIRLAEKELSQNGRPDVIRATWAQLNDAGKVFGVSVQDRIFRNSKDIRYRKPIHEILASTRGRDLQLVDATEALTIMHTGYVRSVIVEKGKRNVPLLKKAVQDNPDDYDSWAYLAEAFSAEDHYTDALLTAEKVLDEGLYKAELPQVNTALMTWLTAASTGKAGEPKLYKDQAYGLYERYCKAGFSYPDIEYGMACFMQKLGDTEAVIQFFETALQKLEQYKGVDTLKMAGNLNHIYDYLAHCYSERMNPQKAVYYCILSLRFEKFREQPLIRLLDLLKKDQNTTGEQTFGFLGKIYELNNPKDKLFILRAAIKTQYQELEQFIRSVMSEEELKSLEDGMEKPWHLSREELKTSYPMISVKNRTDQSFLYLIGELRWRDVDELHANALADKIADMLRENWEDILTLYSVLNDYRSRQCLYGLLEMWLHREDRILSLARENGLEFWDMDIIPTAEGMTCADVGEHLTESMNGFLYTYEDTYDRIYFFEQYGEKEQDTKKELSGHRDVSYVKMGSDGLELDKAVEEPLDLIRMDVSAGLLGILSGCRGHIEKEQPKLAVCLDSDCNHLWQVPKFLREWNPQYKFYLRYYGKKQMPDRVVLFAV